jgi:hypothetical protein
MFEQYHPRDAGSLLALWPAPPLSQAKLDKRGFLSLVYDGRYKFSAPSKSPMDMPMLTSPATSIKDSRPILTPKPFSKTRSSSSKSD